MRSKNQGTSTTITDDSGDCKNPSMSRAKAYRLAGRNSKPAIGMPAVT